MVWRWWIAIHLQPLINDFLYRRTEGLKYLEYNIWWAVRRLTSLLDALPHMRTELGLWNSKQYCIVPQTRHSTITEFGSTVAHGGELFCPRRPKTDLRYVPFSSMTISSTSTTQFNPGISSFVKWREKLNQMVSRFLSIILIYYCLSHERHTEAEVRT